MSELKEEFSNIFHEYITRHGADELFEWLEKSDFFTAPASTRFHGNYASGLLEHSLNVYKCLKGRISSDIYMWNQDGSCKVTEETIAICALLHDACKINMYKPSTRNVKEDGVWVTKDCYEIEERFPCGYHADKSIIILQQFIKLEPEEMLAIRAHMGGFDSASKAGEQFISKIFDRSRLAVHLHLADMEASYLVESRGA